MTSTVQSISSEKSHVIQSSNNHDIKNYHHFIDRLHKLSYLSW
jgi:hypothetical protein